VIVPGSGSARKDCPNDAYIVAVIPTFQDDEYNFYVWTYSHYAETNKEVAAELYGGGPIVQANDLLKVRCSNASDPPGIYTKMLNLTQEPVIEPFTRFH
jgi:hypothetical protein